MPNAVSLRLLAATAVFFTGAQAPPAFAAVAEAALDTPRTMPALPLVRQEGTFSLDDFKGRWVWLYFGFANCPGACPVALDFMAEEYERLEHPETVQPLFVSLDPARDTPEKLAVFAHSFNQAIVGATGTRATLDALTRAAGTSYEVLKPDKPGGNYAVLHPNQIFVLNPEGELVGTYEPRFDTPPGLMAADFNSGDWQSLARRPATTTTAPLPSTGSAWCGGMPQSAAPLHYRSRTLGSGTSILPAASPMHSLDVYLGDWLWMFHGDLVGGYNWQLGPRGESAWAAENWGMAMGSRFLGPGILDLRLMASLEPLTLPPGGTPQFFQTGETYQGAPLIDHQHPHDLIMELAGRYTWNLTDQTSLFLYGGPAGEPALGPSAFMHRPSAADNHWAPLGHHFQDSTHIAYGVATAGVRYGDWQLEGSAFNGREPDEFRWDLDLGPLNSYSTRLSYFPGGRTVAQLSTGWLHEPEVLHPGDVWRTTASLTHIFDTGLGPLSVMAVWGRNVEHSTVTPLTHDSFGLEGQYDLAEMNHLYGRYELVDKDGLPPGLPLNHVLQRTQAFTLGYVRDLDSSPAFDLGLGADVTAYALANTLKTVYGDFPLAARVYLRLRPPLMRDTPGGS